MKPRNFPGRKLLRQAKAQGKNLDAFIVRDVKFRLGASKRSSLLAQAQAQLAK